MNGRAYDYNLGRFLSVDPFIQEPGNSQSMNPYSYIMNNPLAGTDPSGYIAKCDADNYACQWDKSIGINHGHASLITTPFAISNGESSSNSAKADQDQNKSPEQIESPGSIGARAASNAGIPSNEAKEMTQKFLDPEDRADEYRRIGNELIKLGHHGAGQWFLIAADTADAIDLGFEGFLGATSSVWFMGGGAIDSMEVVQEVSIGLGDYNFQNYIDLKTVGTIKGLEGLRGKELAIEMAAYEQQIAQSLLDSKLSSYSLSDRTDIINNMNERFNGVADRPLMNLFSYASNTAIVLNEKFPNHDFKFNKQQDRFSLAVGLINNRFGRNANE